MTTGPSWRAREHFAAINERRAAETGRYYFYLLSPSDYALFFEAGILDRPEASAHLTGLGVILMADRPRGFVDWAGMNATVHLTNGMEITGLFDEPALTLPWEIERWLRKSLPAVSDRSHAVRQAYRSEWSDYTLGHALTSGGVAFPSWPRLIAYWLACWHRLSGLPPSAARAAARSALIGRVTATALRMRSSAPTSVLHALAPERHRERGEVLPPRPSGQRPTRLG